jgi:methoxymalonate biosynthesis acyl carrier protein
MDTVRKIREFIERNLVIFDEGLVLKDEDNIFELGYVDSPFAIKLVSFIEEEFKVDVDDNDLDILNFNSVLRIVKFIGEKKKLKEGDGGP